MKTKKLIAAIGWFLLGVIVGWLFPISGVQAFRVLALSSRIERVAETTILFQRMCSELLSTTPLGQHYLDLGYGHMEELVRLLWYDETMAEQTWRVIDLYSPAVEALLDGKGSTVRVSQEMVDELLLFLSEMEKRADPELGQIIQEERARVPWQGMVGLTVEEAWIKLQEVMPEESAP
ncbi:MAG: hypothetical protein ACUVXE_01385 [Anaerolineae bacterium]